MQATPEAPPELALSVRCCLVTVAAAAVSYTLSLHDALPICASGREAARAGGSGRLPRSLGAADRGARGQGGGELRDRKSTRLNSSHLGTSYAVFCLKKKNHA